MTDHTQLRKLAEAVKPGWFTCHTGKCVGQFVRGRIGKLVTREGEDEHPDFAFIAAANPQAILELLDENERKTKLLEDAAQRVRDVFSPENKQSRLYNAIKEELK